MFRIKICGVTTAADASFAVSCGADAIGLNCYRGSKRYVPEDAAREIVRTVGTRAEVVAVFVNESPEDVVGLCGRLGIRRVQLHGDEPAGDAARIGLWRMKAVHAEASPDFEALAVYPCEAFLVDAGGPGEYGGTGRTLPWEGMSERFARLGKPWILAGGLTPENVGRAIAAAKPSGVDTASGVETAPGRKDPDKVKAFIENARAGFEHAER